MSEATLPLQVAVATLLDADAPLRALVADGLLDPVPQGTQPPYLYPSGWQEIEDGADCFDAAEVFFEIQCVSADPARDEIAAMAGAVKRVLHRARPAVTGYAEVEIEHRSTLFFSDADGVHRRAVVQFRALVDSDA